MDTYFSLYILLFYFVLFGFVSLISYIYFNYNNLPNNLIVNINYVYLVLFLMAMLVAYTFIILKIYLRNITATT